VRAGLDKTALALALLAGCCGFIASALLAWLLGAALNGWLGIGFAVLAAGASLRLGGASWRAAVQGVVLVLAAGAATAFAGQFIIDLSVDTQQYHQQAIMLMSQGWNPLHEPQSPLRNVSTLWVDGYAKTHWIYAALLMDLGVGIEAGKSFSWMLALASGLLVHALLTERLGWSRRAAAVVTVIVILNPVFSCQWQTLLNDQMLAFTLLLALASLAWAAGAQDLPQRRRRAGLLVAVSFALLVAIKASGVAYAGLFVLLTLPLLAWGWGRAAALRMGAWAVLGSVLGVLTLGFNPYVTNTVLHGHPFYPLAGEGKVDIITGNAPAGVLEHSRAVKLFGSLAARSSSTIGGPAPVPPTLAPKVPGSVSMAELKSFMTKNDTRIAGFGPWFSLALLASIAGAAWAWRRRLRSGWHRGLLVLPSVLLLASALAFPEPWWARYVPQVWLIPMVVAIALITLGRREGDAAQRRVGWGVVAISAVNAALVALLSIAGSIPRQADLRAQLDSLRLLSQEQPLLMDFGPAPAAALMLDRAGVRWKEASGGEACTDPASWVYVEYTFVHVCLDRSQRAGFVNASPWIAALKARL